MLYISFDDEIDVILMEKIIVLMMKWKIVVVHNLRVHQEEVVLCTMQCTKCAPA